MNYSSRMTYLKIATFRGVLYGKYMKISFIGISGEIFEKYESVHMNRTKSKQGLLEIPKKWGCLSVLIFLCILEQVSKGCHNQQAQQ